jgi:hypothetical protein
LCFPPFEFDLGSKFKWERRRASAVGAGNGYEKQNAGLLSSGVRQAATIYEADGFEQKKKSDKTAT